MRKVFSVCLWLFTFSINAYAFHLPISGCGYSPIQEVYVGTAIAGDVSQIDEAYDAIEFKRSEKRRYIFLNSGRLSKFIRIGGNGESATFIWDGDKLVSVIGTLGSNKSRIDYLYDYSGFPYKVITNNANGHFVTQVRRRGGSPQWTDGRHIDICVKTKQEAPGWAQVKIAHYSSSGDLLLEGDSLSNKTPKLLSEESIYKYQNDLKYPYPDGAVEKTHKQEGDLLSIADSYSGKIYKKVWYDTRGLQVGAIELNSGNEDVTKIEYEFDSHGNWVLRTKYGRTFVGADKENPYKWEALERTVRSITYR